MPFREADIAEITRFVSNGTMWNPEQYLKFAQPRFRPAQDLLARIAYDAQRTVYDLGCGTGNVTRMLTQR